MKYSEKDEFSDSSHVTTRTWEAETAQEVAALMAATVPDENLADREFNKETIQ